MQGTSAGRVRVARVFPSAYQSLKDDATRMHADAQDSTEAGVCILHSDLTMTLVAFMAANDANAHAHAPRELDDRRASSASAPARPTTSPAACSGSSVGLRSTNRTRRRRLRALRAPCPRRGL